MRILKTLSALILGLSAIGGAMRADAATIDLGFALDESGSVSDVDFTLAQQGLANALAQIPTSGPDVYRLALVAFTGSARTIIDPIVVTAANLPGLQTLVGTFARSSGGTAIDAGVNLLTSLFTGVGLGDTTIFNVTTDGQSSATALQAAAAAAFAAGVDGLSYEGVGSGVDTTTLLSAAFPGTPVLVTDAADLPNPLTTSFVFTVSSFADYEAAITAKVGRIVGPPPMEYVPVPAALPLLVTALGALGGAGYLRRRKAA